MGPGGGRRRRRTGRRPGNPDTREEILAAAREVFAASGYDRASIRQVAAGAGVDPALVHHYFGTKERLFAATVNFPLDPAEIVAKELAGDVAGAGERLVRTFVTIWDSPLGAAGVALLRSAVSHDLAGRLLREFLTSQILRRVATTLDLDPAEAELRASLVASQISGLGLTRYVLKIEPIASASADTVVAAIGPTVQRYLTGRIDAGALTETARGEDGEPEAPPTPATPDPPTPAEPETSAEPDQPTWSAEAAPPASEGPDPATPPARGPPRTGGGTDPGT